MLLQVATWYGAHRWLLAPSTANDGPTSTTSGARLWPLSCSTAVISCPLEPSGLASVMWMWYLAEKSDMIAP